MILQLHAQNPIQTSQTTFLSQFEVATEFDLEKLLASLFSKWLDMEPNRPKGWIPLVVTEESDLFWRTPDNPSTGTKEGE